MDTSKNDNRLSIYKNSPDTIRKLYESNVASSFFQENYPHSDIDQNFIFLQTVGDVILGFFHSTELPKLLQEKLSVSADEAQKISAALQDFLAPVIAREKVEDNLKKEELNTLADTFEQATQDAHVAIVPEGNQNGAVQSLRTMQSDMHKIHGYGVYRDAHPTGSDESEQIVQSPSQDDILKKEG